MASEHDPCLAAFGVPTHSLRDASGAVTPSLLFAAYYGRVPELDRRLKATNSVLTDEPIELTRAARVAIALVCANDSGLAQRVARAVRDLILDRLATDQDGTLTALGALSLRVDRSMANHSRILRGLAAMKRATDDEDRASIVLDLYRLVVEGQLRPWAWTVLQLLGVSAPRMPELGRIRRLLMEQGGQLADDIASAVLVGVRNAAAHEDYEWDAQQGAILVGDEVVGIQEVQAAVGRALDIMSAAEAAWICARAIARGSRPAPAVSSAAEQDARAVRLSDARDLLGANGLRLRSTRLDGARYTAVVEELEPNQVNPCFQALMWTAGLLPEADLFEVHVGRNSQRAFATSRDALGLTQYLWLRARDVLPAMPTSVFVPANVRARLEVETPNEAGIAAAWLTVNDAVHATLDAADELRARIAEGRVAFLYMTRLALSANAARAARLVIGESAGAELAEAERLLGDAADAGNSRDGRSLSLIEGQISALHMSLPVPALLPTWHRTPIG